MTIIIKYSLFAVIATLANIGSQDIAIRLYFGTYSVSLSILVGTAVGLVVKYILDRKYIFRARIKNINHDVRIFFLYTIMGVLTTIVFWGFEFAFDFIFQVKEMRYFGGIIGLSIGYVIKYFLDKNFVFKKIS